MYEIVFYALLAEGDAAVEMVRRRGGGGRHQEMMHASPPLPGCVHAPVSDCHGGAISQSQDNSFNLFIYLAILSRGYVLC